MTDLRLTVGDAVQILPPGISRTDRAKFLMTRRTGVGGSDASAVLSMSRWTSTADVWEDKTGRLPLITPAATEAAEWGLLLEPVVRDEYARRTDLRIVEAGTLRSTRWPWMILNPDGLIVDHREGYEGKIADARTKEWTAEELADHAELQAQHAIAVTGFERWHVACLVGGNRLVVHVVERDDDLIETLVEAERRFWFDYVQAGACPPPDGSEAYLDWLERRYPVDDGGSVGIDPKLAAELIAEHRLLREQRKELESRERSLAARVKSILGAASSLTVGDREIASWRRTRRFCAADFRKKHPEIAEQYDITTEVDELDLVRLEAEQTELYRQFCSRPLTWRS